ncbi:MAG TPA: cytochrome c-type biogenesis protein CcmH [Actinomycetota bacterium]|nr:cytochrome c-type biogenesis protein CcmH [Actinomycetota bacterium]
MRPPRALVVLLVCAGFAGFVACASPEVTTRSIETQVWSPYCPGRLLSECTTSQAADLREQIDTRVKAGQSERQIMSWLRDNYGDEVLARPSGDRSGRLIWLVPLAAAASGAVLLAGIIRRWSRPVPAASTPPREDMTEQERRYWVGRVRSEAAERGPDSG